MACPLHAQKPPNVVVQGQVVDRLGGTPVAGAAVTAGDPGYVVLTNREGRFKLDGVRAGPVTIQVMQLGYGTWNRVHEATANGAAVHVELEPDPVILKQVQVVADRIRARRNAVGTSVRAYTAPLIQASGARDVLDFLRYRVYMGPCPPSRTWSDVCVLRRGSWVPPSIVVDEVPMPGGLEMLGTWPADELHMIEVYSEGGHIRLYTNNFADRLAHDRVRLFPFLGW